MNTTNGIDTEFPMNENCDPNQTGLSKREYFAVNAMQAQLISYGSGEEYRRAIDRAARKANTRTDEFICAASVILADNLIKELNRKERGSNDGWS